MSLRLILPLIASILLLLINSNFSIHSYLSFETKTQHKKNSSRYDYAAIDSRGKILDNSRDIYGAKGILIKDKDKYLLVPCQKVEKWVDISLSEDILIDEVMFLQGEIYSSPFKEIEIWYSFHYPTDNWEFLSTIILKPDSLPQKFHVNTVWVRYLKIIMKSYYGNEYYCTLSQFSVFGTTLLQNLNEDYIAQSQEIKERLSKIPELIIEDEDFDYNENYTYRISDEKCIGFDENTGFRENQDVCVEFYYESQTCTDKKSTEVAVVKKNANEKTNVFTEIIRHIAQTELRIEMINRYIAYFTEAIKRNNTILKELRQKSDFNDLKTRKVSLQIAELKKNIDKLWLQNLEISKEFVETKQQLFFLQYLLALVIFLLIAVLILFSMHLKHIKEKIECKKVVPEKMGNFRKVKRAGTFAPQKWEEKNDILNSTWPFKKNKEI
ncbi:hypothetical protein SteCoe_28735 [Stentor coeruleus]|uniref:SUN domain-containing protein n=1 Tax=Stentor coeruleus TaxID=5963 RepID=A0A1R2B7H8_9CILI|nr:hypothetical protein SteCoe_28735 [Stentor coeruleus]